MPNAAPPNKARGGRRHASMLSCQVRLPPLPPHLQRHVNRPVLVLRAMLHDGAERVEEEMIPIGNHAFGHQDQHGYAHANGMPAEDREQAKQNKTKQKTKTKTKQGGRDSLTAQTPHGSNTSHQLASRTDHS